MERPVRIPYAPHKSSGGLTCLPPALCSMCSSSYNKCIYCKMDNPPCDRTSHLKHLLNVVIDTFRIIYIDKYPRLVEIRDETDGFKLYGADDKCYLWIDALLPASCHELDLTCWILLMYLDHSTTQ